MCRGERSAKSRLVDLQPEPGSNPTPWQYLAAGNLKSEQAFDFLAGKAGAMLVPILLAGVLVQGLAGLDATGIVFAGVLVGGASILVVYLRRRLDYRKLQSAPRRSVRVSDARLYDRHKTLTMTLRESGLERKWHETPEEYSRRASETTGEPAIERLGEIYLYTRFRDAVPASLVEEFDDLEPAALTAARKLARAETADR